MTGEEPSSGARRLLRSIVGLILSSSTGAGLGVAFWVIAARAVPVGELGEDSAIILTMQVLASASDLNLNVGLPRLLPVVHGSRVRFVLGSYAAAAAVAALGGLGFVRIGPMLSGHLATLLGGGMSLAIILALPLWSLFALQDAALVASHAGMVVAKETTAFGILKIGLVLLFAARSVPHPIFWAWTVGMALVAVPVNLSLFMRILPGMQAASTLARPASHASDLRPVLMSLVPDYLAVLLQQVGVIAFPLLVTAQRGSEAAALFNLPFTFSVALDALTLSVSGALTAAAVSSAPDGATALRTAKRLVAALAVLVVVAFSAAPLVMRVFGPAYEAGATTAFRYLLLGFVPQAVIVMVCAGNRVLGLTWRNAAIQAGLLASLALALLVLLRGGGATAAAQAWAAAHIVVALAALVACRDTVVAAATDAIPGTPEVPGARSRTARSDW